MDNISKDSKLFKKTLLSLIVSIAMGGAIETTAGVTASDDKDISPPPEFGIDNPQLQSLYEDVQDQSYSSFDVKPMVKRSRGSTPVSNGEKTLKKMMVSLLEENKRLQSNSSVLHNEQQKKHRQKIPTMASVLSVVGDYEVTPEKIEQTRKELNNLKIETRKMEREPESLNNKSMAEYRESDVLKASSDTKVSERTSVSSLSQYSISDTSQSGSFSSSHSFHTLQPDMSSDVHDITDYKDFSGNVSSDGSSTPLPDQESSFERNGGGGSSSLRTSLKNKKFSDLSIESKIGHINGQLELVETQLDLCQKQKTARLFKEDDKQKIIEEKVNELNNHKENLKRQRTECFKQAEDQKADQNKLLQDLAYAPLEMVRENEQRLDDYSKYIDDFSEKLKTQNRLQYSRSESSDAKNVGVASNVLIDMDQGLDALELATNAAKEQMRQEDLQRKIQELELDRCQELVELSNEDALKQLRLKLENLQDQPKALQQKQKEAEEIQALLQLALEETDKKSKEKKEDSEEEKEIPVVPTPAIPFQQPIKAAVAGKIIQGKVPQRAGIRMTGENSKRIHDHLKDQAQEKMVAAGDGTKREGIWGSYIHSNGKQNDEGSIKGYSSKLDGVTIGADADMIDSPFSLGAAFSAAKSQVNVHQAADNVSSDFYLLSLYGNYTENNCFIDGIVSYGIGMNDYKSVVENKKNKATGDSKTYGLSLSTGYNYALDPQWSVQPRAEFNCLKADVDAYKMAKTRYKANSLLVTELGLGTILSGNISLEKGVLTPELSLMGYHDFNGGDTGGTAVADGQSLKLKGLKRNRNRGVAGAGVSYSMDNNLTLGLDYDYDFSKGYRADSVKASVGYLF
ncbi:putative surface cell antigen sca2 [invertebrate metagenome]|uniref:Putative surface cell antigen sca2 n=1 Tax=invertebrate metagenome TaxID=1711999 RepID=A0A2H9TAP9_9ZZZZ